MFAPVKGDRKCNTLKILLPQKPLQKKNYYRL